MQHHHHRSARQPLATARTRAAVRALALILAPVVAATAQECGVMEALGSLPGGGHASSVAVSADGEVVVGYVEVGPWSWRAFRWTAATGMVDLGTLGGPNALAFGVNEDGSVVVGGTNAANGDPRFFRWSAATGMQDVGIAGGGGYAADAACTVLVGDLTLPGAVLHAFRWSAATGVQDLGTLGSLDSHARGVSADGAAVVGASGSPSHPFRWTAASGMVDLGVLSGFDRATAYGANADGSIVVGTAGDPFGPRRAFLWSAAAGAQELGAPVSTWSEATAVSADGHVVVGNAGLAPNGWESRAFRWTEASGPLDLGTLGGAQAWATATNANGAVVVGAAQDASGVRRAFRWTRTAATGTVYCAGAANNSTGVAGRISVQGCACVAANELQLDASGLPPYGYGCFLASRYPSAPLPIVGTQGALCLAGFIGRFVGPGQVSNAGPGGALSLVIDLRALPSSLGSVAAQPGEEWSFQAWYRDANPGPTSNFTAAISVRFAGP
ncbi:MAG: hypothetical protein R3F49_23300 [Planctomycetota bacterium]